MSDAVTILIEDYDYFRQALKEADTPRNRRSYVRAAFAAMEGLVDWVRQKAADATCTNTEIEGLNITRLQLLGLDDYRISKTGKIESSNRRTPFLNYTAFVLRSLAEELEIDFEEHISDAGWSKLQIAVRARDRLTHPKTASELSVSDEEIEATEIGILWVFNSMLGIFYELSQSHPDLPPFPTFNDSEQSGGGDAGLAP
ncbi:MAG: hypothetical protein ACI8UO_004998 [Verrucomicrobiales bacterium]|jgi:hypothetical protein